LLISKLTSFTAIKPPKRFVIFSSFSKGIFSS
jgi:hypothetical protein